SGITPAASAGLAPPVPRPPLPPVVPPVPSSTPEPPVPPTGRGALPQATARSANNRYFMRPMLLLSSPRAQPSSAGGWAVAGELDGEDRALLGRAADLDAAA